MENDWRLVSRKYRFGGYVAVKARDSAASSRDRAICIAPEGIEPPTNGLGNRCSILLSYGAVVEV